MNLTKSILISDTFDEFDKSSRALGGTITVSSGVLTVNSTDSTKSTYAWLGMYSTPTSIIEVTFEAKTNTPSTIARVGIDGVTIDGVGGGSIDLMEIKDEIWKTYKIVAPANPNGLFTNIVFGFWSSLSGNVSFRNIKINEYDGNLQSTVSRYGVLLNDGGWKLDDRFANFGIQSVTAVSGANPYLRINIAHFESRKRPVSTATLDGFYALTNGYKIITSNSTKTHVYIYIMKDGAIVDPSTVPNNVFINLLMIAD